MTFGKKDYTFECTKELFVGRWGNVQAAILRKEKTCFCREKKESPKFKQIELLTRKNNWVLNKRWRKNLKCHL